MKVDPLFLAKMLPNMAAANVTIQLGALGYTNTVSTACAAGTQAIGDAVEVIRRGAADVMLAGGTEAGISEIGLAGFSSMRALASSHNDEPSEASRPFDRDRDGFAPSEGAGLLLIEELEHALARGARPHAEVLGYGVSAGRRLPGRAVRRRRRRGARHGHGPRRCRCDARGDRLHLSTRDGDRGG